MNQNQKNMVGLVTRGLLTAMLVMGGCMQLLGVDQVVNNFHNIGIDNITMIRVIGLFKIAGAFGLWVPQGKAWAVHGCVFLFVGALSAHFGAGEPVSQYFGATLGLVFLGTSEWFSNDKKRTSNTTSTTATATPTKSKKTKRAA